MASYKTTLKKKTNNDTLYPQTTADIVVTGTSNVETVLNNQESRIASLEAQATKNKGYFETEQLLLNAYPNNIPDPSVRNGWYAIVGNGVQQQASMYIWDLEDNEWVNTGATEYQGVASVNGVLPNEVGEVTVTGTNINATANLETKSINNHLQSLYTEIDEVIENSGRVQQLDFTGTLENNVWTFAPTVLGEITLADLNENNLYELNLHSSVVGVLNNTDTMLLQIEGTTINIATMFTTGNTATVGEMVQVFREDNELGHQWTFNAMYNEKTVDSVTVRAFTIQPTVNDIPQNVKDTLTELENQTNVKYLTSEEMLNAIDTNTYEDGQTAVCITDDGYELGHLYKFTYSTTTPVTYEWVDITVIKEDTVPLLVGTQDNPIILCRLNKGCYIINGYNKWNDRGTYTSVYANNVFVSSSYFEAQQVAAIQLVAIGAKMTENGITNMGYSLSSPEEMKTTYAISKATFSILGMSAGTEAPVYNNYNLNYLMPYDNVNNGKALSTTNTLAYMPTSNYHPATKMYVDNTVATKQDILTAGTNITIENNVISSTGGGSSGMTITELTGTSENPVVLETLTEGIYKINPGKVILFTDAPLSYADTYREFYLIRYNEGTFKMFGSLVRFVFGFGWSVNGSDQNEECTFQLNSAYGYNNIHGVNLFNTNNGWKNGFCSNSYPAKGNIMYMSGDDLSDAVDAIKTSQRTEYGLYNKAIIFCTADSTSVTTYKAGHLYEFTLDWNALSSSTLQDIGAVPTTAIDVSNKLEASNILAGTNVTVSRNGNNVTINSAGGSGGTVPPTYVTSNTLSTFLKVTVPSGVLTLPFETGTYDYKINKGDGSEPVSYITGGDKELNYEEAGTYWIEIYSNDGLNLPKFAVTQTSSICDYLYEVYVGANHSDIGKLNYCNLLTKVYYNSVPESVSSATISSRSFDNCYHLSDVTLPTALTSIGSYAFSYSGIQKIQLPNSITLMAGPVFQNCMNLEEITLPTEISAISANCFQNCSNLRKITIPSNVNNINLSAFRDDIRLNEVVFEKTSTFTIGNYAFFNSESTGKAKYIFNTSTPPTISATTFNPDLDFEVYVPSGSLTAYQTATNWSTISSKIKEIALVNNLGTASSVDIGTSSGNVPVIGNDGKLDSSIIPSSGGGGSSLETIYYSTGNTSTDGLLVTLAAGTGTGGTGSVDLTSYISTTDGYKGYIVYVTRSGIPDFTFTVYTRDYNTANTTECCDSTTLLDGGSEATIYSMRMTISRATGYAYFSRATNLYFSSSISKSAISGNFYIKQIWGIK